MGFFKQSDGQGLENQSILLIVNEATGNQIDVPLS